MSAGRVAALVVVLGALAREAHAAPPALAAEVGQDTPSRVPTVGLSLGGLSEHARLETFGSVWDEDRTDLRASMALGLAHPVWRFGGPGLVLDGHASVALGPTFNAGRWQLPLRDDVTLAWASTSWLTLRGGVGVGVVLDATRPSYSLGEFAIPVSLTFWDLVEVVARPALAVGFTADERRVFGGTLGVGPGVALVPLDVTLRFRAARWGF